MLTLTKTSYGFRSVAAGQLTVAELAAALVKFSRLQPGFASFGYLCDQRTVGVMSDQVQLKIRELMGALLGSGLTQIAIICSSPTLAVQSNARMAGTAAARFSQAFDGSDPRWKSNAMEWITRGAQVAEAA